MAIGGRLHKSGQQHRSLDLLTHAQEGDNALTSETIRRRFDCTGQRSIVGCHVTQNALKVRLFIKPYCGWCHRAMNWLEDHKIPFEALDVISDAKAYAEMVNLSGQTLAPVIEVNGKILADFGPDDLERFWKHIGPPA